MATAGIQTLYGVARDGKIIGTLYDTAAEAEQQCRHIADTMTRIGLTPDVVAVQVEVKTTIGTPKPLDEVAEHWTAVAAPAEPETDQ